MSNVAKFQVMASPSFVLSLLAPLRRSRFFCGAANRYRRRRFSALPLYRIFDRSKISVSLFTCERAARDVCLCNCRILFPRELPYCHIFLDKCK